MNGQLPMIQAKMLLPFGIAGIHLPG